MFCKFWLRNVLHATTACTFSTSQLPKVVRTWCVLYILTSKCASRHSGVHFFDIAQLPKVVWEWCVLYILAWKRASRHNRVHFFISHLASWLRTRRFSEPIFSTLRSQKSVDKHSVSRLSYLFAHLHLLSSDSFSSLIFSLLLFSLLLSLTLSISAFHLSVLSEVWLLNFLRIYNYCLVVGMMIQFDFRIVQRGRYTTNIPVRISTTEWEALCPVSRPFQA